MLMPHIPWRFTQGYFCLDSEQKTTMSAVEPRGRHSSTDQSRPRQSLHRVTPRVGGAISMAGNVFTVVDWNRAAAGTLRVSLEACETPIAQKVGIIKYKGRDECLTWVSPRFIELLTKREAMGPEKASRLQVLPS